MYYHTRIRQGLHGRWAWDGANPRRSRGGPLNDDAFLSAPGSAGGINLALAHVASVLGHPGGRRRGAVEPLGVSGPAKAQTDRLNDGGFY